MMSATKQEDKQAQATSPGQLSPFKQGKQNMSITILPTCSESTTGMASQPPMVCAPGTSLADEIYSLLDSYSVITHHEKVATTLWVLSSWVFDEFRVFPRLAVISPQKRCGKSTLLEVVNSTVNNPLMVANATMAVISRVAESMKPTLLLDEADTFVKCGDPQLIGLINSGHSRATAKITKCVGDNYEPKVFSTWMPVALASIGDLSDTIMDRSIRINLRRKKSSEHVQRIPHDLDDQCADLRLRLKCWQANTEGKLASNLVSPTSLGNDRAVDNWIPLFTVADVFGDKWRDDCELAYRAITPLEDTEPQTQLLADIRDIFENAEEKKLASTALVAALCKDPDKPWATFNSGRNLSPVKMASMLQPYGITPKGMRVNGRSLRGYEYSQFLDAIERYLQ